MPINENHWKIVFNRLNLRLKIHQRLALEKSNEARLKPSNYRCENFEFFQVDPKKLFLVELKCDAFDGP